LIWQLKFGTENKPPLLERDGHILEVEKVNTQGMFPTKGRKFFSK
jgi:hypothetical protein